MVEITLVFILLQIFYEEINVKTFYGSLSQVPHSSRNSTFRARTLVQKSRRNHVETLRTSESELMQIQRIQRFAFVTTYVGATIRTINII